MLKVLPALSVGVVVASVGLLPTVVSDTPPPTPVRLLVALTSLA